MIKTMYKRIKKIIRIYIFHQNAYGIRLNEYRQAGIKIGNNCNIYSSLPMGRDCFLLSIGDNVTISGEVGFINHDNAVIKPSEGAFTDLLGKITIGNNCFIGYRTTICPGVHLADHTIVGMGSVVTKSVDKPGYVIAGNPARVVCTVEEYMEKNKDHLVNLDGMTQSDIQKLIEKKPELLITKKAMKIKYNCPIE